MAGLAGRVPVGGLHVFPGHVVTGRVGRAHHGVLCWDAHA